MKKKIYTKTGDKGETSLFTGERVPKNDPFIEALGSVDECNSALGSALAFLPPIERMHKVKHQLETVQHALFDVGASLATPRSRAESGKLNMTRFGADAIRLIETWIDEMEDELPKLNEFILPGGHPSGALLHLARSICRRAERRVLPIFRSGDVSENVIIYLNRLSDYLFSVSRYVNFITHIPETRWEHHRPVEV